jgi:hypothetical protein
MMKTLRLTLLLSLLCFGIVRQTNAQSTFAGSFCAPPNPNPNLILPVGDIALTLDDGQVSFKCMLLSYMPTTNIVAWLAVGPKQLPIELGTGTEGTWPLQEFLWPVSPAPGSQGGIDPGFGIPPTAEGTCFTGTFTAPPNLEHLLLARGGTVYLQIHGTVAGMQNPLLSATLQNVTPIHCSALCTGRAEIPPNTSPHRATAEFTLTGNILAYTLTADPGFAWTLVGIYGPATRHSKATELVAQLPTAFGVIIFNPAQPTAPSSVIYSGAVNLTDQQAADLKRGLLDLNFLTTRYPRGEIRGPIQRVPAPHLNRSGEP